MYVYVYMYIYMYICVHIYTYTNTPTCTYTCAYTCTCTYVHMHIHMHIHTHIHVYVQAHISIYIYIYTHMYVHVCMYVHIPTTPLFLHCTRTSVSVPSRWWPFYMTSTLGSSHLPCRVWVWNASLGLLNRCLASTSPALKRVAGLRSFWCFCVRLLGKHLQCRFGNCGLSSPVGRRYVVHTMHVRPSNAGTHQAGGRVSQIWHLYQPNFYLV